MSTNVLLYIRVLAPLVSVIVSLSAIFLVDDSFASSVVNAAQSRPHLLIAKAVVSETNLMSSETEHVPVTDLLCMAENIYYEAGVESHTGKLAVGYVVLNRVKISKYPATICEVIFQKSLNPIKKPHTCQFEWVCNLARTPIDKDSKTWRDSVRAAKQVLATPDLNIVDGATHYHAVYVNPWWNKKLIKINQIDRHIFYKYSPDPA